MHDDEFTQMPPAGGRKASLDRFQFCARRQLLQHAVPAAAGGLGDTFRDLVDAHQVLGRSSRDSGLVLSINAHLWGAVFPLLNYGTEEQRQTWLGDLLSGELLGGHAITEPQAGSDLDALAVSARKTEDGFVLGGRKRYITNTPIADLLVVYARLEDKLSAFIVCRDDEGVQFCAAPTVKGCRSATMGDVILDNCRIPSGRQLGKTGSGKMMIQHALELERAFIFAGIAGIMDWQLQTVIRHSRERKVNGRHLGANQAISHRIADMQLRLETLRLWIDHCAQLKDNGRRLTIASAQTKLYGGEAFLQSSLDAVHILGSSGIEEGSDLAVLVDDAIASRLFSGSSEMQKNIIAALLGTGEGFKG